MEEDSGSQSDDELQFASVDDPIANAIKRKKLAIILNRHNAKKQDNPTPSKYHLLASQTVAILIFPCFRSEC